MQNAPERMNDSGTRSPAAPKLTHGCSTPVLYELVSYRGEILGPYTSIEEAAEVALMKWPDQPQDEERRGEGWDIQVAGAK